MCFNKNIKISEKTKTKEYKSFLLLHILPFSFNIKRTVSLSNAFEAIITFYYKTCHDLFNQFILKPLFVLIKLNVPDIISIYFKHISDYFLNLHFYK